MDEFLQYTVDDSPRKKGQQRGIQFEKEADTAEQIIDKERRKNANALREAHRQGREEGIKSVQEREEKKEKLPEYERNTTFRQSTIQKSVGRSRSRSPPCNLTAEELRKFNDHTMNYDNNRRGNRVVETGVRQKADGPPRKVAGVNGFFPDPIPLELSGIVILGDGAGYRSRENWEPPTKFDSTQITAVQWINKLVESAQDIGMAHNIILHKLLTGSLLGSTAKLCQKNYKSAHPKAFKVVVATPAEQVENETIALTEYIEWFCQTFYVKQSKQKIMSQINEMSLASFDSRNAKGEFDLCNCADMYHAIAEKCKS
jgi:hypothetical protein